MLKTALRHLPLLLVILISFAFVSFALAHETGDPAHVHAEGEAMVQPIRPLQMVRQKAAEIKQNAIDAKAELHLETKAQMQNASSGPERRAIMQGSADARIDIMKQRQASTSNLRDKAKNFIRQHTGLIKERFSLALRQFEKLVARIESRIEKLKAEGVATATVEADLELAKTANAEAKADIQAVADFTASVDENADRAQVRAQMQTLTKEAQASIQAAHKALQKVVRGLVALAKENKPRVESSTSVEVETDAAVTTE